jgi:hypothetical protein
LALITTALPQGQQSTTPPQHEGLACFLHSPASPLHLSIVLQNKAISFRRQPQSFACKRPTCCLRIDPLIASLSFRADYSRFFPFLPRSDRPAPQQKTTLLPAFEEPLRVYAPPHLPCLFTRTDIIIQNNTIFETSPPASSSSLFPRTSISAPTVELPTDRTTPHWGPTLSRRVQQPQQT